MNNFAIRTEGLSKRYRIGLKDEMPETLSGALAAWLRSPLSNFHRVQKLSHFGENDDISEDIIWAINDLSFDVSHGEVVGIIGRNGAGKSTLLKILARITEPTSGRAIIDGRVASLLEVGTGFHQELTGRENVYLNGTILGMTRSEIDSRFDEIVDFSGVERFIDTPVKRYSSGMNVRLAFAVAAHLEPEILLIDEVLAVGDVAFQKKCLGKMDQVAREGRTVLFVSHNMATMQALCQRVIQLEAGIIVQSGVAHEVISHYLSSQLDLAQVDLGSREDRSGSGSVRLTAIRFEDARGKPVDTIQSGKELRITLAYCAPRVANHVSFEISIYNSAGAGLPIFRCSTLLNGLELPRVSGEGEIVCNIPKLLLPASNYYLNVSAIEADIGYADYVAAATTLQVVEGDIFGSGRVQSVGDAVAILEHDWATGCHMNEPFDVSPQIVPQA